MKSGFKYVEENMRLLGKQLNAVIQIAKELQTGLKPRRDELKKLSGTHQLVKPVIIHKPPDSFCSSIPAKLGEIRSASDMGKSNWERSSCAGSKMATRNIPIYMGQFTK